jgi:hypothetical protein
VLLECTCGFPGEKYKVLRYLGVHEVIPEIHIFENVGSGENVSFQKRGDGKMLINGVISHGRKPLVMLTMVSLE